MVVIAIRTAPPGPRGARGRLIDLIAAEDTRSQDLRRQLDALQNDVHALEKGMSDRAVGFAVLQREISSLGAMAGTVAVAGPGVSVELRDSTLRSSPTGDLNDLVIHEQDLQAVVNALWSGGAEAMTINGERITSTSAVRCVGNTLLLHGTAYAPPYRIDAIGAQSALQRALRRDPSAQRFRVFAEEFRLGFDVRARRDLKLPAFRGVFAFDRATPVATG